jgi:hypothetical protein
LPLVVLVVFKLSVAFIFSYLFLKFSKIDISEFVTLLVLLIAKRCRNWADAFPEKLRTLSLASAERTRVENSWREALCRYPQRSRPSEQRRPAAKINATLEGARQKGSWLRRLLVIPQVRDGDAPRLLLAIRPSASTATHSIFSKVS